MISTATVDAIKSELTAHLRSRTEWDELPAVFTMHKGPAGPVLSEVPVPEVLWVAHGHPPTAVAAIAAAAPRMPRSPNGTHLLVRPLQGPLIGVVFRYEAYALRSDSPNPVAREAARRQQAGGSVPDYKDVPGRIEQRCMTAVDLDGGRYMASSGRIAEGEPDATDPVVHYLAFADPDRDQLSGNVVDAVIRLLNAIKPLPTKGATP
ncbi:hypothetical protein [Streptomyces cylindrosporus]|uniref:Uncharacterized protein n=1 Tax=Streptomyces cylindrosporus TaxID=2927583 RepID=A0ABS9YNT3_9ACTN|nr:hypothetical protein [Streptomyces cylindrosporus]MCI3277501.1 hypothetical protein [Streptomyces cylindrosporus]